MTSNLKLILYAVIDVYKLQKSHGESAFALRKKLKKLNSVNKNNQ